MNLYMHYIQNPIFLAWAIVFLSWLPGNQVGAQQSAVLAYVTQHSKDIVEDLQAASLEEALMNLVESRELEIVYAPELVKGKTSDCVRFPKDNDKALECILADSGLEALKHQGGVYIIQHVQEVAEVQVGRIVGTIQSASSADILAHAHILVKDTQYSTTSSLDGTFFIDHMTPGTYDIQVSMLGYEPSEFSNINVKAGQDSELYLNMVETTLQLDEVLITDRKKRGLSLPDSLDPLAYQGFKLGRVRGGLFMSSSPAIVEGVQFSGLGSMARDSLKGVQFSGMFNSAQSVDGVQFGGVFNTVKGDLNGSQFSGVLNQLGGTLVGGQYAGTFNKAGDVRGVQLAGIGNVSDGRVRGLQASGIVNASGDKQGAQLAGVANRALRQRGFQGAGVMNYAVTMQGMQGSGVLNATSEDARGVQASGVINFAGGRFKGAQLAGVLNVAGHVDRGVQIGLVNFANTHQGTPIGLFSFVKDTGVRLDTWIDERGFAASAVRSGNRKFANYLGVGGPTDGSTENGAILFGLGGEFSHTQRLYSTVDGMYYVMGLEQSEFDEHMIQSRLTIGYKLMPYIAIFGGPSLNLLLSDNLETTVPLPNRFIDRGEWGDTTYRFWAGFTAGIRISTNKLYTPDR